MWLQVRSIDQCGSYTIYRISSISSIQDNTVDDRMLSMVDGGLRWRLHDGFFEKAAFSCTYTFLSFDLF